MPNEQNSQDLSSVNQSKEKISPQYRVWYESSSQETETEQQIRILRDEIFSGLQSSTGRKFTEILATPEELAERDLFTFNQKDVDEYHKPEAIKERRRTLNKGKLFEPNVVLGDIISPKQRERREEGLHRPPYEKMLLWNVTKKLVTSGSSPIDVLGGMAKSAQLALGENWIEEEEWVGERKLEEEEVELILAEKMSKIIGIDLDDLIEYHQRVCKVNGSAPTYLNKHDQHLIPASQGGLSQRPLAVVSHWYEHLLVANEAAEALNILNLKNEEELETNPHLKRLRDLTFFAYQMNAQATELLRNSIPISPSLGTKHILQKRKEICSHAQEIFEQTKQTDLQNRLSILSNTDLKKIYALTEKIVKNGGNLHSPEQEFEQRELPKSYRMTIEKLELAIDLLDRDYAVDHLKTSLRDLERLTRHQTKQTHIDCIQNLIKKLENGQSPIYIDKLDPEEYEAILQLQESLDRDILIDIAIPRKIRNIRPAWRFRLDLEENSDLFINPYNDKGTQLRMLLDILEEPDFVNIFPTGGPPKRVPFTESQLNKEGISEKIYGDLRYLDILHAFSANKAIKTYYETLGVHDKEQFKKAIFPEKYDKEPPSTLQNVDLAAESIYKAILEGKKIATIGDCDQDGFFASVNWRWTLEHLGVNNIEQKFNTRIEGHSVQPIDILNLALRGNEVIIVNDTGSSLSDIETFELIKKGCTHISCLKLIRENIEDIDGFKNLSPHEQQQIKRAISKIINDFEQEDKESLSEGDINHLLTKEITTGEKYTDKHGNTSKEYKFLEEYSFIKNSVLGFPQTQIIVCDHHTPTIETVKYFRDNKDIIMVNPEWVKEGMEDVFIQEMSQALQPDENGKIDVVKLNQIQRKYSCYPEIDIVGTVTAGKTIERLFQLFSDRPILKAETSEIYKLPVEERKEEYRKFAEKVLTPSLRNIKISILKKITLTIPAEKHWKEKGSLEKIEKDLKHIQIALEARLREIIEEGCTEEEAFRRLEEFENLFGVKFNNLTQTENHTTLSQLESMIPRLNKSFEKSLEKTKHTLDRRIKTVIKNNILTEPELRFYLDYLDILPKSFFSMDIEEKEEYMQPLILKIAKELDKKTKIKAKDRPFSTYLRNELKKLIQNGQTLRDFKKIYFNLIEQGYKQNGGVPKKRKSGKTPETRSKVRYEGNKIWEKTLRKLLNKGSLTQHQLIELNSYIKYGPFGNEYLKLTQATATLGDGGHIDLEKGLENRWRVVDAMISIEKFIDKYWEEEDPDLKKEIKRIEPEILRLVRTSLRGTNMRSVNWHISRLFTHSLAAFVNAMYRRGKDERSEKAKEYWKEASDFCVLRSENETVQRHRHTLPYAQEVTIETRENLFKNIIRRLEKDEVELEKPLIITKLEGRKFIDPIKGLRGLIAGMLANRYDKPAMVLVEEQAEKKDKPARYSVSFRLPDSGNVATDMVQMSLAMNPVQGINIVAHGGHPEASGGTWEVFGGVDKIHEVLDPIFEDFKIKNKDAGVVKMEELIKETLKELDDGWSDLEEFDEYVNPFEIADILASQMYKQTNPNGVGLPELLIEFEDLTVVNITKGKKNDGNEYYSITLRDKRGNTKGMRLFEDLEDLAVIQKGDILTLRAQPIMRLRELEASNLEYNWPLPNSPKTKMKVSTVTGAVQKPHLDIRKILDIK